MMRVCVRIQEEERGLKVIIKIGVSSEGVSLVT